MKFLHNKRRMGILGVLTAVLGTAALFFSTGASADPCGAPDGDFGDATLYVPGVAWADLDQENPGTTRHSAWACFVPPRQGVGFTLADPNPATAGATVAVATCGSLTHSCTWAHDTGAEVDPAISTNSPFDATATGSGGTVGLGSGTCAYVDGSTSCYRQTLALGDVLGLRTLYPCSCPLPAIYAP